jgi:uncharacterized membrane protein YbhN (UPF0104 family)
MPPVTTNDVVAAAPARHGRRLIRALSSALVSGVFLWWFVRGLDLSAVVDRIRVVRWPLFAGAVTLSLTGFVVRSLRSRYFLAPLKWVRLSSSLSAVFIGWTATAVLPGRVGEVARAVVLARRENLRVSATFGTVVLERLVDACMVVVLVAIYLLFESESAPGPQHPLLFPALRASALAAAGALTAVALFLVGVRRLPEAARSGLRNWIARLPGGQMVWNLLESFASGLEGTWRRTPGSVTPGRLRMALAFHTLLLWALVVGTHMMLLRSFGFSPPPLTMAPLIFLITIGISAPTPAALGTYHAAVQFALTAAMGLSRETAAGYAILSHAIAFIPSVLIGVVLLAREGMALSTIVRSES